MLTRYQSCHTIGHLYKTNKGHERQNWRKEITVIGQHRTVSLLPLPDSVESEARRIRAEHERLQGLSSVQARSTPREISINNTTKRLPALFCLPSPLAGDKGRTLEPASVRHIGPIISLLGIRPRKLASRRAKERGTSAERGEEEVAAVLSLSKPAAAEGPSYEHRGPGLSFGKRLLRMERGRCVEIGEVAVRD